jgi:hypothetical protein
LSSVPLNLPLFSKTSLVTSQVYSVEHLFNRPYAVKNCPVNPPTSYTYRCYQPPVKSVKTRRKSLISNKVYLQMAGRACSRDGLAIQGLETCSRCITEVHGAERICSQNSFGNLGDFGSLVAWRRTNRVCFRDGFSNRGVRG